MGADNLKLRKDEQEPNRTFENDADRIVHRHLQNKDDVITDEDLRSIRIGISPDETTTTDAEAQAKFDLEGSENENGI